MLVCGEREEAEAAVAVREHGRGDTGSEPVEAFAERLETLVKTRARG
jgi:threonyl-tRNA synthetase